MKGQGFKILLVEDEDEVREQYRDEVRSLANQNRVEIEIHEAVNVAEALSCIAKENYNVTILDWQLKAGAETGTELLERVRDRRRAGRVIGISGIIKPDSPEAQAMLERGADDVIWKGESGATVLLEMIEDILGLPERSKVPSTSQI